MEGVWPRGGYVGPWSRLGACSWDVDAVQGVASIKVSVLGNIALWTESENPDLVENVSTTDIDVLGHQKADRAITERCAREKPPQHSDDYTKRMHRKRENPYTKDAYD